MTQRITRSLAAVLVLVAGMSVAQAERLTTPRPHVDRSREFVTMEMPGTVAGLGIGSPAGLAMGDAWVTSDLMVDDNTTSSYWCVGEYISVVGLFSTSKPTNVKATITVKTQSGNTIVTDTFTGAPITDEILGFIFDVGNLEQGNYKVTFKYKQGDKIVGQSFWIGVFVCS